MILASSIASAFLTPAFPAVVEFERIAVFASGASRSLIAITVSTRRSNSGWSVGSPLPEKVRLAGFSGRSSRALSRASATSDTPGNAAVPSVSKSVHP